MRALTAFNLLNIANGEGSLKFEPVPLSEELVVMMGGRKANLVPNSSDVVFNDNECSLYESLANGFTIYRLGNKIIGEKDGKWQFLGMALSEGGFFGISAPMEFVHQLQNYYPAFTGEELTLNFIENGKQDS